mmetsp:Transcript_2579/g.5322  ORF Transcript_2579/g.5322 Transcript_2579/m.5322 type:complete len:200 (-) Transcript_2579:170-769(-)
MTSLHSARDAGAPRLSRIFISPSQLTLPRPSGSCAWNNRCSTVLSFSCHGVAVPTRMRRDFSISRALASRTASSETPPCSIDELEIAAARAASCVSLQLGSDGALAIASANLSPRVFALFCRCGVTTCSFPWRRGGSNACLRWPLLRAPEYHSGWCFRGIGLPLTSDQLSDLRAARSVLPETPYALRASASALLLSLLF